VSYNDDINELFSTEGFSRKEITRLAFESGFCKRKSGKIDASDFLLHFCLHSLKGTVSYNDIAAKVEAQTGINASRQAYHQRMGDPCVVFFEKVLETVINSKYPAKNVDELAEARKFTRILVQDSTIIRLPLRLFDIFSGVKNAHTSVCNARIQGVYDLIARKFIKFSIDSYKKNDLSVTLDMPVEPGDLVLRDRGYFNVRAMKTFKEKGADTINRYKHKTTLFDTESGEEINLLEYLKKHGSIDEIVLAGSEEKYKVRIIAKPVNEETSNLRRMKAKKESKGKNPSKKLLELMSWSIFVTTITDPEISFETILLLYGFRWRIENIFKTWKSNFSFDTIHNVSARQLHVLLTARLIMITFINHKIFNPLWKKINKVSGKSLSMMKFMRYIQKNLDVMPRLVNIENISERSMKAMFRFCTYDQRKRSNFETTFELVLSKEFFNAIP